MADLYSVASSPEEIWPHLESPGAFEVDPIWRNEPKA
jgi:hypothetical protein